MKGCISAVILALCCLLTQLWGLDRGKKNEKKAMQNIKQNKGGNVTGYCEMTQIDGG